MEDLQTGIPTNPAIEDFEESADIDGSVDFEETEWVNDGTWVLESELSEIDKLPAIRNWEPAPAYSAFGAVAGGLVWIVLACFVGPLPAWIIQTIVLAVYALVFYRSYFTPTPRIVSSKIISFLNYAVSFASTVVSVVFGWCWNRNLRTSRETGKPHMGYSYIVAIVYFCLTIGLMFWYENTYWGSDSMPFERNDDGSYSYVGPTTATIPTTDTVLSVPGTWQHESYEPDGAEGAGLLLVPTYAEGDTYAFVIPWDLAMVMTQDYIDSYADSLSIRTVNEEVVLGRLSGHMDTVANSRIELVEINGIEYWKAQVEGTDSGERLKYTAYYCVKSPMMYEYVLSSSGESNKTNNALEADFEEIVKSAQYE